MFCNSSVFYTISLCHIACLTLSFIVNHLFITSKAKWKKERKGSKRVTETTDERLYISPDCIEGENHFKKII